MTGDLFTVADQWAAFLLGGLAGALIVFLVAAWVSAAQIRRLDDQLREVVARDTFRRCRLLEVRACALELRDRLEGPSGPGDLLELPDRRDPWAARDRDLARSARTIAAAALDGLAGHVVFDVDNPRDAETALGILTGDDRPDHWPAP